MEDIIRAWQKAAVDLDLKIHCPFTFYDANGQGCQFEIVIENFGSKKGAIIMSLDKVNDIIIPQKLGVFFSQVNPEIYGEYDRENFIDTLIDWGYFGTLQDKPEWYPGDPIIID